MSIIRKVIHSNQLKDIINLPEEFINQEIEIVIQPLNRDLDLLNHSVSLVEEWVDEREDEIWI